MPDFGKGFATFVHVVLHPLTYLDTNVRRDGDDLKHTLKLTLLEALIGYDKRITQLDGRQVGCC